MTEQELRALVRDVIAQRAMAAGSAATGAPAVVAARLGHHPSHGLLPVAAGGDADGACVIEPAVRCNHCGYCQSYGH